MAQAITMKQRLEILMARAKPGPPPIGCKQIELTQIAQLALESRALTRRIVDRLCLAPY